jgi:hypothetical protein
MIRPVPFLLLSLLAACSRRPAASPADGGSIRSSGRDGSPALPRFAGTWTRPSPDRAGGTEALVMERGHGLKFVNVCRMRGVSWVELPGDSLVLTTTVDGGAALVERRFHLRQPTDTLLALDGAGYEAGSWVRGVAPPSLPCPAP